MEIGILDALLEDTLGAVGLFREQAEGQPEDFLPKLTEILRELNCRFKEFGLCDETLDATREAVAIYRKLNSQKPQEFILNILLNFEYIIHKITGSELREVLDVYRKLAASQPEAYRQILLRGRSKVGLRNQ